MITSVYLPLAPALCPWWLQRLSSAPKLRRGTYKLDPLEPKRAATQHQTVYCNVFKSTRNLYLSSRYQVPLLFILLEKKEREGERRWLTVGRKSAIAGDEVLGLVLGKMVIFTELKIRVHVQKCDQKYVATLKQYRTEVTAVTWW
jgi:hypothetical protein